MSSDPQYQRGPIRWSSLIVALIAMLAIIFSGLQSGPFGRRQIVGMSPAQENQLGFQAFQQTLQEEGPNVLHHGPIVAVADKLKSRLADAAKRRDVLERLRLK